MPTVMVRPSVCAMGYAESLSLGGGFRQSQGRARWIRTRSNGTAKQPTLGKLRALDDADQQQQEHGADHRYHQAADETVGREPQKAENEMAEQRADDADDEVHEHAHAVAFDDQTSQPAA